jgi:hypothetical protein
MQPSQSHRHNNARDNLQEGGNSTHNNTTQLDVQHHADGHKTDRYKAPGIIMHRQEAHPEEETNLEQLALQQLNLIDIQIIAVVDAHNNQHQHEVPIPPTITDPFWREFNDWRRNNPDDYNEWLNNRNQLPPGDTAPENTATNATGDNAPDENNATSNAIGDNAPTNNNATTDRTNTQSSSNDSQTTGSTCGESYTSDTLTITSTGDSCITSLTGSSYIADSIDSYYTANDTNSTTDSFITYVNIISKLFLFFF